MKRTVLTCDHCGAELDEMHDYTDMEIGIPYSFLTVDLCVNCAKELERQVKTFCNKEEKIKGDT